MPAKSWPIRLLCSLKSAVPQWGSERWTSFKRSGTKRTRVLISLRSRWLSSVVPNSWLEAGERGGQGLVSPSAVLMTAFNILSSKPHHHSQMFRAFPWSVDLHIGVTEWKKKKKKQLDTIVVNELGLNMWSLTDWSHRGSISAATVMWNERRKARWEKCDATPSVFEPSSTFSTFTKPAVYTKVSAGIKDVLSLFFSCSCNRYMKAQSITRRFRLIQSQPSLTTQWCTPNYISTLISTSLHVQENAICLL